MIGLSAKSFPARKIYCSQTTREVLKTNERFKHAVSFMIPLELNVRHTIPYKNRSIQISLIPSNHCAGSVMFLLEDESSAKSVLCTGDVRAENWWIQYIARNPILFPYTTNVKTLDNIYLDTTYGYRGEPFIEMQNNYQGLRLLTFILDMYPKELRGDEIGFFFADKTLGFEDAWVQTGNFFNETFHFEPAIRQRAIKVSNDTNYEFALHLKNILRETSGKISKFHVCGNYHGKCSRASRIKFKVRVKACIDVDIKTLMSYVAPVPIQEMPEIIFLYSLSDGSKVYQSKEDEEKLYLLPNGSNKYLKNEIIYFYSRHSSYDECKTFVELFKPKQVYPMTESKSTWDAGFQMKRQFGNLCKNDDFIYDEKALKLYKSNPPILANPPKTVNKFDPEGSFYKDLNTSLSNIDSFVLNFKGQQDINTAFAEHATSEDQRKHHQYLKLHSGGKCLEGMNQYRYQKQIIGDPLKGIRRLIGKEKDSYRDFHDTDETQDTQSQNSFISIAMDINRQQRIFSRSLGTVNPPSLVTTPTKEDGIRVDGQSETTTHEDRMEGGIQGNFSLIEQPDEFENDGTVVEGVETKVSDSLLFGSSELSNIYRSSKVLNQKRLISGDEPIPNLQNKRARIDALVAQMMQSPVPKKTRLDETKIKRIEEKIRNDESFGFFNFPLLSSMESKRGTNFKPRKDNQYIFTNQ